MKISFKAGVTGLLLSAALLALTFSCTKEDFSPNENLAFSSNGLPTPPNTGGDEIFQTFRLKNGKSNWSNGGVYTLGLVSDEKVRQVYIFAEGKHSKWMRVDPVNGDFSKGSFDPDAFLRNQAALFNPIKDGFSVFAVGPLVYVTDGKRYGALRVDQGEVFREGPKGGFPSGISKVDYLPFRSTADFPGTGVFIGVTNSGYVAGSTSINGNYLIPGIELGTPNSNSDVNYSSKTAGKVACLEVISNKAVVFTLDDGSRITGFAQRGGNEFIKVD